MNEALRLARYQDKNPPAKLVTQALKIRSKVERSNTNRRQKNMTTQTPKLGPLGRAMVELDKKGIHPQLSTGGDGFALKLTTVEDDREVLRLSDPQEAGAFLLAEAAQGHPAEALQLTDAADEWEDDAQAREMGRVYGTEQEMREAVERRMKADPENYTDR